MDKIDTQGLSVPTDKPYTGPKVKYSPRPFKKLNVFTDEERKELKQLIHEVLDEREYKYEDDSWLYRGTY